mgnify:CR=1 FL=1
MQPTKSIELIALLLAFAVFATVSAMDAKEAESVNRKYCEMIALWEKDIARGIAPEQRAGWPPYDGRKQCEENEEQ